WVFLWLQAGDADAADQAFAATVRAFRVEAAQLPMAEWPGRYWRLLAACPLDAQGGQWPPGLDLLATPAPADRRALLLRLAGGLDEQPAAEAMGVALGVYRERLAAACPRDATGQVDVAAWHGLAQAIQQAARDLPESRLERIAALRETALAGHGTPEAPSTRAHAVGQGPGRGRRTLWVAPLLLAVAARAGAGAWWWWQQRSAALPLPPPADDVAGADDLRVHDRGPILVEPLPDPAPPAVPADPVPPALDEPPLDPVVAAVDFLSWYAAGAPASRMEREAGDAAEPLVPAPGEGGGRLAEQAWAEVGGGRRATRRSRWCRRRRRTRAGWRSRPGRSSMPATGRSSARPSRAIPRCRWPSRSSCAAASPPWTGWSGAAGCSVPPWATTGRACSPGWATCRRRKGRGCWRSCVRWTQGSAGSWPRCCAGSRQSAGWNCARNCWRCRPRGARTGWTRSPPCAERAGYSRARLSTNTAATTMPTSSEYT